MLGLTSHKDDESFDDDRKHRNDKSELICGEATLPQLVGVNQDEEELAYEVSGLNEPELTVEDHIGHFNQQMELSLKNKEIGLVMRRFRVLAENWRHSKAREILISQSKVKNELMFKPQIN